MQSTAEVEIPLRRPRGAPEDAVLVAALRRGETAAFEKVMRRYNQRLFRTVRGIVTEDAEAEDVVQEAYIRAFLHIGEFKGGALGAWLTRIAVNEALGRLRSAKRRPAALPQNRESDEVLAEKLQSHLPSPEHLAAQSEIRGLLEQAIDGLPEDFRLVFMLRAVEQLDVQETAESLDIKPETVRSRDHRARQILQIALSRHLSVASIKAFPFAGRRCDRTVDCVLKRLRLARVLGG